LTEFPLGVLTQDLFECESYPKIQQKHDIIRLV